MLLLHAVPPSHPCMTVEAAIRLKGLEYERVDFSGAEHPERMQEIYGEGNSTVPGVVFDGEPVHGSRAVLARLEELVPEPTLYPDDAVREAERWADEELQDMGRRLPWGALHFRPEAMGTFARPGGQPLDGAGTDYAIRYVRACWRYHNITAARLQEDLGGMPAKVEHIERLAADGVIGGAAPNAADLHIGATIRVLLPIRDLDGLLDGTRGREIALALFPDNPGEVPAGAYPAGWTPSR